MIKKDILKIMGIGTIVLIILLTFWFSSNPGSVSMGQSDEILLKLNLISQYDIDAGTPEYYHWRFLIRKGAHFFIFLILGIGLALVMEEDVEKIILIIIILAVFDEVHQSFTGRGARLSDVILDVAGGFTGWTMVESLRFFFKKSNEKEREG